MEPRCALCLRLLANCPQVCSGFVNLEQLLAGGAELAELALPLRNAKGKTLGSVGVTTTALLPLLRRMKTTLGSAGSVTDALKKDAEALEEEEAAAKAAAKGAAAVPSDAAAVPHAEAAKASKKGKGKSTGDAVTRAADSSSADGGRSGSGDGSSGAAPVPSSPTPSSPDNTTPASTSVSAMTSPNVSGDYERILERHQARRKQVRWPLVGAGSGWRHARCLDSVGWRF